MSQQQPTSDLRAWLENVDREGELLELEEAHWDKEMGAISELVEQELARDSPALLFDDIPGYSKGYRTLYNHLGSVTRLALAVGLPTEYDHILDFVDAFSERTDEVEPRPTQSVSSGPVMENVRSGEDVDLTEVPVPKHHELDGGRYMGTACCVITRDPDDPEWVNLGTYRGQIRSEDDLFVYISPGKHGRLHRDQYFERDEPMPVVVTFGQHPVLRGRDRNRNRRLRTRVRRRRSGCALRGDRGPRDRTADPGDRGDCRRGPHVPRRPRR